VIAPPAIEIVVPLEAAAYARINAASHEDECRVALELVTRREGLLREIDEALRVLLDRREERA
jgi:hypothetical protein